MRWRGIFEEYQPAYDQESADSVPESSTCSLATGDEMDGNGRKPLGLLANWFVTEKGAAEDFSETKTVLADSVAATAVIEETMKHSRQ